MANDANLEIYCPACRWEPEAHSEWECSCGHQWNTFDTAGVCPSCQQRWPDTQCLSCAAWAPHIDWYHGLDEVVAEVVAASLSVPASVFCGPNES